MRWLVLVMFVGLVGCVPPPVYRVQRTARVPRPAAPLKTGEPVDGMAEISFGASSIGEVRDARLMDHAAAVEVPDQQYRGELRIRVLRGELAAIGEFAPMRSMYALDATQAPVNEGRPVGRGAAIRYSIDAGNGLSFGLGLEAMSWEIPYVEYRTCVDYCAENDAPQMQVFRGVENVESANFAFTPTYRRGAFAVFAGAYTRPQPTIKRKGSEIGSDNYDSDVVAGPYNWIVHAGAEYRLPYVSILAQVQQDLTRDPVWFGPSFGLAIATRLPEPKQHAQPAPDAQAQPW